MTLCVHAAIHIYSGRLCVFKRAFLRRRIPSEGVSLCVCVRERNVSDTYPPMCL